MRDAMKGLDELEMGDLWERIRRQTPHLDPRAPRRWSLPSRVIAAMVALAVFAGGGFLLWRAYFSSEPPLPAAGERIDLALLAGPALDGAAISEADLAGKTIVIGAWASWCRDCETVLRALEDVAARYEGDGSVVVIGLNVRGDDRARAEALTARVGTTFPSLVDSGTTSERLRLTAVPVVIVVGPEGEVVQIVLGSPTASKIVAATLAEQVSDAIERSRTSDAVRLAAMHDELEAILQQLWTTRASIFDLTGEIEAAREELVGLEGGGNSAQLRSYVLRWEESRDRFRATEARLQESASQLERQMTSAAAPIDVAPASVVVTCTGDGNGGMSVEQPLVQPAASGLVHLHVLNDTERATLWIDGVPVAEIRSGEEADVPLPLEPGTRAVLCTYGGASSLALWQRPTHPLLVLAEPA